MVEEVADWSGSVGFTPLPAPTANVDQAVTGYIKVFAIAAGDSDTEDVYTVPTGKQVQVLSMAIFSEDDQDTCLIFLRRKTPVEARFMFLGSKLPYTDLNNITFDAGETISVYIENKNLDALLNVYVSIQYLERDV